MLIYVRAKKESWKKIYSFKEIYSMYIRKFWEIEYNKMRDELRALDWFINPRMYEDNNFIEELLKDKDENEKWGDFLKAYNFLRKVYEKSDNGVFKNMQNILNTITKVITVKEYSENKWFYKVIWYKSKQNKLLYAYKTNQVILESAFDMKMYYKDISDELRGNKDKYRAFWIACKDFLEKQVL